MTVPPFLLRVLHFFVSRYSPPPLVIVLVLVWGYVELELELVVAPCQQNVLCLFSGELENHWVPKKASARWLTWEL